MTVLRHLTNSVEPPQNRAVRPGFRQPDIASLWSWRAPLDRRTGSQYEIYLMVRSASGRSEVRCMIGVSLRSVDRDDMAVHYRDLDELGYTVLTDLLTPAQVGEAITALQEIYDRESAI